MLSSSQGSSDTGTNPDPFDMLFRAKWNIPQATKALGFPANEESWGEVMEMFRDYCKKRPKTHVKFETLVQPGLPDA